MGKLKKGIVVMSLIIVTFGIWSFADDNFKIAKGLDIYFNLFKELNFYYVDEVNPEKLIQTSIDGMLESLDPYTTFIPESELDDFKFQTTGQYGGIGALIRKLGNDVVIAEPYENFPAAKGGLKPGDILLEIDGKSLINKSISDVSEMLKGTPNTEVSIEFKRTGIDKVQKKKLIREKITVPNVPYFGIVKDSIGYIRLTNFTTDAGKDVRNAVIELKKQQAKGIILDLRGNPGGLLIEAVSVVNNFVNKNKTVVFTKGKIKEVNKNYVTTAEPVDTILPMAVLVNRGSASASEIVAGCLQDLDRAVIIGQRSYGKGLVQQTRPLSYNTQLKVTTAKYYIPSGRCIQALDYSHRNDDGSVGHVPDSLIKEFKTKAGRKVFDGGGIQPDIKVTVDRLSDLALNLYSKNFIFNYATTYASMHDTIAKVRYFKIDDSIYNDFSKYLEEKDFEYKTSTEEKLTDLIETAKRERYYDNSVNELKQLKEKLAHNKSKDLITYRNEIADLLTDEIVVRYYYQKGKIEASFPTDNEVNKAVDMLKNDSKYSAILNGSYEEKTEVEAKKPENDDKGAKKNN